MNLKFIMSDAYKHLSVLLRDNYVDKSTVIVAVPRKTEADHITPCQI